MSMIQNTNSSQNAQYLQSTTNVQSSQLMRGIVIGSIAAGSIVASALIINSLIHSKTPILSPIPDPQNMVVSLLKKISENPLPTAGTAFLGYKLGDALFPDTKLPMRDLKVFCITVLAVGGSLIYDPFFTAIP